jgi:hypothetical protein
MRVAVSLLRPPCRADVVMTVLTVIKGAEPFYKPVPDQGVIFQRVADNSILNGNLSTFGALRSPATNQT